jgi:hypothetical protein
LSSIIVNHLETMIGSGHRPWWRISAASLAAFLVARSDAPAPALPIDKLVRKRPLLWKETGEESV